MKEISRNQRGAVLVTFAILLVALLGFAALATEAGRWYLVRSELSKAVDAASLAGAKNISNPYVTVNTIAQEVGNENFPAGQLGTPGSGVGSVSFTVTTPTSNKIKVDGRVNAIAILARLFGIDQVATASSGVAQKNKVEIMMVLDRSGSMGFMGGQPIADLKNAATSFLSFFRETQAEDKLGLISFATGVTVDYPLGTNFVNAMTTKISNMTAIGATNAEDAIAQAGGPQSFTNQTGVPGDQRIQQYLIFFTDGHPTAFRGRFRSNGIDYDAVVMDAGYTWDQCYEVYPYMGYPNSENFYPTSLLTATTTGDGNQVTLTNCNHGGYPYLNTRWYIFGDSKYGLSGYNPVQCRDYNYNDQQFFSKSYNVNAVLPAYICNTARQMAIDNAQALKDKGIKIYTIGLGDVDAGLLGQVASGSTYYYYTPTSDQLQAIFNTIAKEIKLRLVQ
jgi:Flp pilus assembly protein TadG